MRSTRKDWTDHFQIESEFELDFVIGQKRRLPVGMERRSPAEFKRRVLAAMLSYLLQLNSIDYTLKRYVDAELYEAEEPKLGDTVSDYLRHAAKVLREELKKLHTQGDLPLGVLGAELTLYRLPDVINTARMMSNWGLLLEVLPLLRLTLEMAAWAHTAFYLDGDEVFELKAQNCISSLKGTYNSAGQLYGFLSQFAHWGHAIHGQFFNVEEGTTSVVMASVRYRAMSLSLCLVILDIVVEVVRKIYAERSSDLVSKVQGVACPDSARHSYQYMLKIVDACELTDVRKIKTFLQ